MFFEESIFFFLWDMGPFICFKVMENKHFETYGEKKSLQVYESLLTYLIYGLDSASWNSWSFSPSWFSAGNRKYSRHFQQKGMECKKFSSSNSVESQDFWFPGHTTMAEIQRSESCCCCCFWHCCPSSEPQNWGLDMQRWLPLVFLANFLSGV